MRFWLRGSVRRALGGVAALAFATTSPGLSGLEVVAHLAGIVDLTHARQPHFEQAGQTGHSDECQLGRAAFGGRLPDLGSPALRPVATPAVLPLATSPVPPARVAHCSALPRAPPA